MFSKIRAIAFFALLFGMVPFAALFMYCVPHSHHVVRQKLARFFIRLFNIQIQEIGEVDLGADMLIVNHRSILDVICLEARYFRDLCWVAKKELGDIPVLGHMLKAPEMLLIDREDKRGLISLLKKSKTMIAKKRVLSIFPEGTRGTQNSMLPFKMGAKFLGEKLQMRVQPIVLVGTLEVLDTRPLALRCHTVKIIYLDSFVPEKGTDWYEILQQKMQSVYVGCHCSSNGNMPK
jgi:1-acyl-sn-glycerol-3-phosphate acyltransferase